MRHITNSGHDVALYAVAAFMIITGIVAVITLDGGLTRLAVALAIVTTEWWILSGVEHRVERKPRVIHDGKAVITDTAA